MVEFGTHLGLDPEEFTEEGKERLRRIIEQNKKEILERKPPAGSNGGDQEKSTGEQDR